MLQLCCIHWGLCLIQSFFIELENFNLFFQCDTSSAEKRMKTISWFLFAVTQGCVIQPFVLFSCDGATWFNSFKINRKSCPTKFDNIWKFSRTQVSMSLKLISHICVHVQWKVCQCVTHVTSYCQSLISAIKTKANMIKNDRLILLCSLSTEETMKVLKY